MKVYFEKIASFFNKYSILFHALLACSVCFAVEWISRHSFSSAVGFVGAHTLAFFYNAMIVFVSLSFVYLAKRRAFFRIVISSFWLILGIINGCVLSNRVTPFGFTDLKCVSDLLTMKDSKYFSATQATIIVIGACVFFAFLIFFFVKGPRYQGKRHFFLAPIFVVGLIASLPLTTKAAQSSDVIASYFGNIAQGYEDYGFIYGFSSSVVGVGMSTPSSYSKQVIADVLAEEEKEETTVTSENAPNIVCVLLESFMDPTEVSFLNLSEDPIPNFRSLYENYSSGHLTVPVVGAGTANSEFEVLTGMSMRYFGTGEYPYKTILKETDCESIASVLNQNLGYGTHVVHNNGGNFYSRANAFAMMGFDTFTSKEMMNIQQYTPLGNWPTDDILVNETRKALDSTDGQDFVYTITVEGHGSYPTYKVLDNPDISVSGAATEEENYAWEYYVNQIHEVDDFIGDLVTMLDNRGEDTILVLFGDHIPTMGLTEEEVATGSLYETKYATWNNCGLSKQDADLTAYQLLAEITDQAGIHEGTMFTYTQCEKDTLNYQSGLELLQYDLLYGDRYAYDGEDLYPATELEMGVSDVTISDCQISEDGLYLCVRGNNFTAWSDVFINDVQVTSKFVTTHLLRVPLEGIDLADGDLITVKQLGSRSTVFRTSNEWTWEHPQAETELSSEVFTTNDDGNDVESDYESQSSSSGDSTIDVEELEDEENAAPLTESTANNENNLLLAHRSLIMIK